MGAYTISQLKHLSLEKVKDIFLNKLKTVQETEDNIEVVEYLELSITFAVNLEEFIEIDDLMEYKLGLTPTIAG